AFVGAPPVAAGTPAPAPSVLGRTGQAVPAVVTGRSSLGGSSARGDGTTAGSASGAFCETESVVFSCTAGLLAFAVACGTSRSRFTCAFSFGTASCFVFFCG